MSLRHYQVEGVDFLAKRAHAILADEPGLGKSAQAIVAAEKAGYRNILIVCPAIGRVSWPIELGKWDLTERQVIHVGKDPLPSANAHKRFVFLVSYDLLSRGGPVVDNLLLIAGTLFFDLLVLDEGQYLKDTSAKRTKLVYRELVPKIPNVWILSGTITPNHNGELYPHARSLFPYALAKVFGKPPSRIEFEDRYCKIRLTTFGRQIVGNQNTHELRDLLDPVLLRRRATEVATELPPLTVENLAFSNDDLDAMLSPTQVHAVAAAAFAFDSAYDETLSDTQQAVHIATERRQLGLAKVPLAAAWAIDLLTSGQDKLILFAHHQDVVSALTAALLDYNPVTITGSTSTKDRVERVKRFQEDLSVRVLVGNIQAAGTSITLTASNRVGIVEPSWVPGENTQAIRRSYRIGQKRPVMATYLSLEKSLDKAITETLIRKAGDIAELLDDTKETA